MVLVGGVAGCGDTDRPSAPGASTPVTTTAAPAPADNAFPLTVTRRGGFAGVDDRIRIAADGSAVVTRRGQTPVPATVPDSTMVELRGLLTDPAFAGRATPPSTPAVCNDGYEYAITSPSVSVSVPGCDSPKDAPVDRTVAIVAALLNAR